MRLVKCILVIRLENHSVFTYMLVLCGQIGRIDGRSDRQAVHYVELCKIMQIGNHSGVNWHREPRQDEVLLLYSCTVPCMYTC